MYKSDDVIETDTGFKLAGRELRVDQYDAVFLRFSESMMFIGKLNGRTPKQAIAEIMSAREMEL